MHRYTYDDILWHCSHIPPTADVLTVIKEALRPGRIEKSETARITGLLNKVTKATLRKLLPDIISAVEQDRANGLKLLEHACMNVDFLSMYLEMLGYITYKDQLATWFNSELPPYVERLCAELRELDQSNYDVFCMTQKKLKGLGCRLRLLQMFADKGYLPGAVFRDTAESSSAAIEDVDVLLAFLGAMRADTQPRGAVARLLEMGETLPFKYKFKIEELMKGPGNGRR